MNWLADDDAVAHWWNWAGTILLSYCLRHGCNYQDAEDAVQETLASAVQHHSSFRGNSDGEFRTYLLRIAHNLLVSKFRKTNREQSLDEMSHDPTAGMPSESRQAVEAVQQAMHKLSPKQREVLELYHFEDMTMQAITGQIGLSVGTICNLVHAAKARLRELLPEYGPDG